MGPSGLGHVAGQPLPELGQPLTRLAAPPLDLELHGLRRSLEELDAATGFWSGRSRWAMAWITAD